MTLHDFLSLTTFILCLLSIYSSSDLPLTASWNPSLQTDWTVLKEGPEKRLSTHCSASVQSQTHTVNDSHLNRAQIRMMSSHFTVTLAWLGGYDGLNGAPSTLTLKMKKSRPHRSSVIWQAGKLCSAANIWHRVGNTQPGYYCRSLRDETPLSPPARCDLWNLASEQLSTIQVLTKHIFNLHFQVTGSHYILVKGKKLSFHYETNCHLIWWQK